MLTPKVEAWRTIVRDVLKRVLSKPEDALVLTRAYVSEAYLEDVVMAMIQQESGGEPSLIGDSGTAHGLMQVTIPAATDVGFIGTPLELRNPTVNVWAGTLYLLRKLNTYRNMKDAILAYNTGGVIERDPSGRPTNQGYLDSVLVILQKKNSRLEDSYSQPDSSRGSSSGGSIEEGRAEGVGVVFWLVIAVVGAVAYVVVNILKGW